MGTRVTVIDLGTAQPRSAAPVGPYTIHCTACNYAPPLAMWDYDEAESAARDHYRFHDAWGTP